MKNIKQIVKEAVLKEMYGNMEKAIKVHGNFNGEEKELEITFYDIPGNAAFGIWVDDETGVTFEDAATRAIQSLFSKKAKDEIVN